MSNIQNPGSGILYPENNLLVSDSLLLNNIFEFLFLSQNSLGSLLDFIYRFVLDNDDIETFNTLFPVKKRSKRLRSGFVKRVSEIERCEKLNKLYAEDVLKYLKNFWK